MTCEISQLAICEGSVRVTNVSWRFLAPAGDDVVALVDLLEQQRDVGRVVLQVGVQQ